MPKIRTDYECGFGQLCTDPVLVSDSLENFRKNMLIACIHLAMAYKYVGGKLTRGTDNAHKWNG
jgi:hypothetical protein